MEFVLFLLAGFLSLAEGQSECMCLMIVICHMILVTSVGLYIACQPNVLRHCDVKYNYCTISSSPI